MSLYDNSGRQNVSASRPTLLLTGGENFNPTLRFDGTSDFFILPNNTLVTGSKSFSMMTVVTPNAKHEASAGKIFAQGTGLATNDSISLDVRNTNKVNFSFSVNDLTTANNVYQTNNTLIFNALYNSGATPKRILRVSSPYGSTITSDSPAGVSTNN